MDEDLDFERLQVNSKDFFYNDWLFKYEQSHILHSQCSKSGSCKPETHLEDLCLYCMYTRTLNLPHLPDMVFPNNKLTLEFKTGSIIQFNALDALMNVADNKLPLQVACANEWQESRSTSLLEEKSKRFDWTFTTTYMGTKSNDFIEEPTTEQIDVQKLMQQDKILFFHELTLYEDELHDHGVASLTCKIRVMPTCFFILMRYFLRVDDVMVKINDTRIFHEFDKSYLLQEYTSRESSTKQLNLSISILTDPNKLSPFLPLTTTQRTKIIIPGKQ